MSRKLIATSLSVVRFGASAQSFVDLKVEPEKYLGEIITLECSRINSLGYFLCNDPE